MAGVKQAVAAQEGDAAAAAAASVAASGPSVFEVVDAAVAPWHAARGGLPIDSRGIPAHDSRELTPAEISDADWDRQETPPEPGAMVLPTAEDVVEELARDAQEAADEEDIATAIADAWADAKEAVAREEGAASGADSSRVADDEPEEAPMQKKMRSAEAEAGPAEAAAASTRGPERRQAMRSRMLVQKQDASEKYSLVRSERETVAEINRVLEARNRAIADEARELFGASTPKHARRALVGARRACAVRGSHGHLEYLVIDAQLQKRARYYAFWDWANTRDGQRYLTKQDCHGQEYLLPLESTAGPYTIPRDARAAFKNHADHVYGGETWLNVLIQMGGCPREFVDCWNLAIDQRLQAAISPRLVCHAGASTPSS